MLSPALGRAVVLSAPAKSTPLSVTAHANPSSIVGAARPTLPALRRGHQRRYSSSNPSCPPGGPKTTTPQSASSGSGKPGRRKAKEPAAAPAPQQPFNSFPSVPSTSHLSTRDIALSSFFSLHRPMSVTGNIPPTRSDEAFNAIFESKLNARKSREVMSTLSNTVRSLEDASEEAGLRWEVLNEAESREDPTHHLDGIPQKVGSFEELMSRFPSHPPPAPGPVDGAEMTSMEPSMESPNAADTEADHKSWRVTVTVTESTNPDGQKNITASLSPLTRLPNSPADVEDQSPGRQYIIEQPMLDRVVDDQHQIQDGHQTGEGDNSMMAISVKRQRKLKMKKHKYKKLMKRTRNLRRKLGR